MENRKFKTEVWEMISYFGVLVSIFVILEGGESFWKHANQRTISFIVINTIIASLFFYNRQRK